MEKHETAQEKGKICAGFNKTVKLVQRGAAKRVFLASDADSDLACQVRFVCRAAGLVPEEQFDKKALGRLCSLSVGCAAAVIPKE